MKASLKKMGQSLKSSGAFASTYRPVADNQSEQVSQAADIDDEILSKLASNTDYAAPARPSVTIAAAGLESGKVVVSGHTITIDGISRIPDNIVMSTFNNNRRDQSRLKNIPELAALIYESKGNNTPVLLRLATSNEGQQTLELVAGRRRLAALRYANSNLITKGEEPPILLSAEVRILSDSEATKAAALENSGREDFDIWELADTLKSLLDTKVARSIEELVPYLPATGSSKKKRNRASVYYYLAPHSIPQWIKRYIDLSNPNDTLKSVDRLMKQLKGRDELHELVAAGLEDKGYKPGTHSIEELAKEVKAIIAMLEDRYEESSTSRPQEPVQLALNHGSAVIKLADSTELPEHVQEKIAGAINAILEEYLTS